MQLGPERFERNHRGNRDKRIVLFGETFIASVQIEEAKLSHANLPRSEYDNLESDLRGGGKRLFFEVPIGFIMGAASSLRFLGEQTSHTVGAFTISLVVNKPNWITPKFRKLCEERVGIDELQEFKLVPKCDFLSFSFAQAMRPARSL
jgi:hypothetical protein